MSIGDNVIFTKRITNHINVAGVIDDILYRGGEIYFYNIKYYYCNYLCSCNVFTNTMDESIELDIEYYRDKKINELLR